MALGPEALLKNVYPSSMIAEEIIRQVDELISKLDDEAMDDVYESVDDPFSADNFERFKFEDISIRGKISSVDYSHVSLAFEAAGWDECWITHKNNPIDREGNLLTIVLARRCRYEEVE